MISLLERPLSILDGMKNTLAFIHIGDNSITDKINSWSIDKEAGLLKYPIFYVSGLIAGIAAEAYLIKKLYNLGDSLNEHINSIPSWSVLAVYVGAIATARATCRAYDQAIEEDEQEQLSQKSSETSESLDKLIQ